MEYSFENELSIHLCPGEETELYVSGNYNSVIWSNGQEGNTAQFNEAGQAFATLHYNGYSINTDTVLINIDQPAELIELNSTPISCFGGSDGIVDISYSFDSGNENTTLLTDTFTNLPQGPFFTIVEGEEFCPFQVQTTISGPSPIVTVVDLPSIPCSVEDSVAVAFSTFGGTSPYSYSIPENHLPPGTYDLITTDSLNCLHETSFLIEVSPEIQFDLSITDETEINLGSIQVMTDIQNTVTITDNNGIVQDPENLESGMYSLSITDENNCTLTEPFIIDFIQSTTNLNKPISSIHAFPNPFHDEITISDKFLNHRAQLYNTLGQIVGERILEDYSSLNWKLSNLPSGNYILRISSEIEIYNGIISKY